MSKTTQKPINIEDYDISKSEVGAGRLHEFANNMLRSMPVFTKDMRVRLEALVAWLAFTCLAGHHCLISTNPTDLEKYNHGILRLPKSIKVKRAMVWQFISPQDEHPEWRVYLCDGWLVIIERFGAVQCYGDLKRPGKVDWLWGEAHTEEVRQELLAVWEAVAPKRGQQLDSGEHQAIPRHVQPESATGQKAALLDAEIELARRLNDARANLDAAHEAMEALAAERLKVVAALKEQRDRVRKLQQRATMAAGQMGAAIDALDEGDMDLARSMVEGALATVNTPC